MTVPEGVEVLSQRCARPARDDEGWTTWRWAESAPMASYLTTVVIGQYRIRTGTHAGKPMVIGVRSRYPRTAGGPVDGPHRRDRPTSWRRQFGPYPFDAVRRRSCSTTTGSGTRSRRRPGRCTAARSSGAARCRVVAHELAHQWFGDSVALERWQDIWLNEGFATYAEWLWEEHTGDAGPSRRRSTTSTPASCGSSRPAIPARTTSSARRSTAAAR